MFHKLNTIAMKKIIFLCSVLLITAIVKGQNVNDINSSLVNFKLSILPQPTDFDTPKLSLLYEGSPFLVNEWQEGSVIMNSGKTYKYLMKYFIYENQIWLKNASDSIRNLNLSKNIQNIQINDRTLIYGIYVLGDKQKEGLLEVTYEGPQSKLLKLHSCRLEKGQETSGYQQKEKDKFLHKEDLYYQIGDQVIMPLPRSKKEFFLVFGRKADAVTKYFKDNKLKMNAEGLSKVFAYYDEIN